MTAAVAPPAPDQTPWEWGDRVEALPGPNGVNRIAWRSGRGLCEPAPHRSAPPETEPEAGLSDIDPALLEAFRARHRQRIAARLAALGADLPSAEACRAWREARGWSQQDVADRAGVSRQVISDMEMGRRSAPGPRAAIGALMREDQP